MSRKDGRPKTLPLPEYAVDVKAEEVVLMPVEEEDVD